VGLPYYLAPIGQRVRDPLHAWLKPSGYVGQSAGILALLLFVFMYLYPLRKRFRALAFTGALNRWLDVHIVVGLALPVLGAIHAGWRFQGLIGLGYVSMLLVSLSGFVGRYLYTRIPRSVSGLELDIAEIEQQREEALQQISRVTGMDAAEVRGALAPSVAEAGPTGLASTLVAMVSNDLAGWRAIRRLRREWRSPTLKQAVKLARREIALEQQVRMLEATRRLFRFWHIVHRPFSITAFIAVAIHVVVVVTLRVTWIW
jgi:hypothetical protein